MKRVEGIRAVTYDCWGTLLRDRDWEGAMTKRLGALSHFLDLPEDDARALLDEAWARHDEAWKQVGTFGPGRMAAYCLEARGIEDDDSIRELTRQFEEASLAHGVDAVDGAAETLAALREKNFGRGLVCDTGFTPGRGVRKLLEDVGLLEYLDVLCFSDEVGNGMHAIRYRGVHDDKSDGRDARICIDDHRELLEILGIGATTS